MRNLLFLLIPLYLVFHLFTLDRYPLPSLPEVKAATIADHLATDPLLVLSEPTLWNHFLFQPVYTLVASLPLRQFGFSIYNFRLTGLVFALFSYLVFIRYLFKIEKGKYKNAAFLVSTALLIDALFNTWTNKGVGETMALFFFFVAIRRDLSDEPYDFISTFSSAFFIVLSILSDPHIAFALPFLLLFKVVVMLAQTKAYPSQVYHVIFWPILFGVCLLPWLLLVYNANDGYVFLLDRLLREGAIFHYWDTPFQHYLLIGICGLLTLYHLFVNQDQFIDNQPFYFSLGILASYHILCFFWPFQFSGLVLFYYLLFFSLLPLNKTDSDSRKKRYVPIATLLSLNLLVLVLQTTGVVSDYGHRKGESFHEFVIKHIPSGSTVEADALSYYALHRNKCTIAPLEDPTSGNCQYILVSKINEEVYNKKYGHLTSYSGYHKVTDIRFESSGLNHFLAQIGISSSEELPVYSSTLYKKVR